MTRTVRICETNTTVWSRTKGSPAIPPDAVYIGRAMPRQRLAGSQFRNPWPCDPNNDQERAAVVAKFGRWLFGDPELVSDKGSPPSLGDVRALAGKPLVCWCAPKLCHGHILAAVADGLIVDRPGLEQWLSDRRPRPN